MAVSFPAPTENTYTYSFPVSDLVSFQEASDLFQDTGYPVSRRTLQRAAAANDLRIVRRGREHYASYTDLLLLHAQMYPPPTPGAP